MKRTTVLLAINYTSMALLGIAACAVVYVGVTSSLADDAKSEFRTKLSPSAAGTSFQQLIRAHKMALQGIASAIAVLGRLPSHAEFQQVRVRYRLS